MSWLSPVFAMDRPSLIDGHDPRKGDPVDGFVGDPQQVEQPPRSNQSFFHARANRFGFNSEKCPPGEPEEAETEAAGIEGFDPETLQRASKASRSAGAIRIFPRRPHAPTRRCGSEPSAHH